jgi:hypothetical protein
MDGGMSIEAWEMVVVIFGGASFLVYGIAHAIEDWKGKRETTIRAIDRTAEPLVSAGVVRRPDRYPAGDPRRNARVG